ncbi:inositol 2-dehydrogenase [Aeromicrobium sp. A1-2]|uniref:Gfo/Idh/MocA family oxidoreductase n=1 Tax=Aeromicrobium sp. A1-2 TaxID=2107713 RepID=UPI000E514652|nr:Gfo/Idh/MocA family oxidoreductase [Aeromicrobium sp. A1-2]AXT84465.1 inositol 2-dehydrogenase [Aeromicrobium sp. A1-2]
MSLRIGVIGAGAMGADHIRTLTSSVPSARVSEVYDFDTGTARAAARPAFADVVSSAEALIDSSSVDAVIIASPDHTHADLVRACLDAGKHVLCEKPLAVNPEESRSVVDAEVAGGRRLVQVGFMRRYDPGYTELRDELRSGRLGDVRLVHHVHRNASSHTSATDAGIVTGSMIHELDTVRWLLDDEVAEIEIVSPVTEGLRDPQLATIRMSRGTIVSAEVFVNASYGYDIRCEVVGTSGTAELRPLARISTRRAGAESTAIRDDFVAHFATAYRLELASWVEDTLRDTVRGPSAWDGHVANVIASAGVASLVVGGRQPVHTGDRPDLYAG